MTHGTKDVDSQINAFNERHSQKTFSDQLADLIHVKFGGREEASQSHEVVSWAKYDFMPRRNKI